MQHLVPVLHILRDLLGIHSLGGDTGKSRSRLFQMLKDIVTLPAQADSFCPILLLSWITPERRQSQSS